VEFVGFRGALANNSGDLTGQNFSTAAAVPFDQDVYDTDDIHDTSSNTSRLTVPAGVTHIRLTASIKVALVDESRWILADIYKNGGSGLTWAGGVYQRMEISAAVTTGPSAVSAVLEVTPGDYFELFLQVEIDTSVTIDTQTWFAMEIVK
jgi:hypothetical protein